MGDLILQTQTKTQQAYFSIVNNLDTPLTEKQVSIVLIVCLSIIVPSVAFTIFLELYGRAKDYFLTKKVFEHVTPLKAIEDDIVSLFYKNKKYFFVPKYISLFFAGFFTLAILKQNRIAFYTFTTITMYLVAVFYNKYKMSFYQENLMLLKFLYWFSFIFIFYVILVT